MADADTGLLAGGEDTTPDPTSGEVPDAPTPTEASPSTTLAVGEGGGGGVGDSATTPPPTTTVTERGGGDDSDTDSQADDEEARRGRAKDPNNYVRRYSRYTMSLLKPVSLSMLVVVFAVEKLTPKMDPSIRRVQIVMDESPTDSGGERLLSAVVNALAVVAALVVVTTILFLLYKYRWYKTIAGWFVAVSVMMLVLLGALWIDLFCTAYEIAYDIPTLVAILWNYAIVGVISIYWQGADWMTQAYLLCVAVQTGWVLTRLPEWTTWSILSAVAVYDLVAVLAPFGPLKVLVEEVQRRGDNIPGLVYQSKQFKLGLGDFVFYSVLVGRAAMFAYTTWSVCFIAVLVGLCGTLFCLGIFRKALPALPISIFLGMAFYFISRFITTPVYMDNAVDGVWM